MFTLDDIENDTENKTDNDNYGFHCKMQNTSHCTETLPLMPLANFSHFIGLATYIILGVAQCEHTVKSNIIVLWAFIVGGWTKWHMIIFNVINMFALMYAFMQLNADTFFGKSKPKHHAKW